LGGVFSGFVEYLINKTKRIMKRGSDITIAFFLWEKYTLQSILKLYT
jgi:hypothetical protein